MPNYSFRCTSCNHTFERLLPLKDFDQPQECPLDHGPAERVLTQAPGSIFTGGGWTPKSGRGRTE